MAIRHGQIEIARRFDVSVARLFAAWTDDEALRRWCCPGDGSWQSEVIEHDFRVEGPKHLTFGPPGETPYVERTVYLAIEPRQLLLCAERIFAGEELISASLLTIAFAPAGDGSTLGITDQIALLRPDDTPEARREGWGEVLDKLREELAA